MSAPVLKTFYNGRQVKFMAINGQEVDYLVENGAMVFMQNGEVIQFFLDDGFKTQTRCTEDADGVWMEFGFVSWGLITGSSPIGWVTPNGVKITLECSTNLLNWRVARFVDCAGSPVDNGDGSFTYWSRCITPNYYKSTQVDFSLTFNRWGKRITGMTLMGTDIPLPLASNDVTQASTLEADLIGLGYVGATVSVVTGEISPSIINHTAEPSNTHTIVAAMSGANVVGCSVHGITIPLPLPSYTMPGDADLLQGHLRDAGYSGAVVKLLGQTWNIALPNIPAADNQRWFTLMIAPGDPFPYWDTFGVYQGLSADDQVSGTVSNIRDVSGATLEENLPGNFARLKLALNP